MLMANAVYSNHCWATFRCQYTLGVHVNKVFKLLSATLMNGYYGFINPQRACAARVAVVCLWVSVCLLPHFLPPHTRNRSKSDCNRFSAKPTFFLKKRFSFLKCCVIKLWHANQGNNPIAQAYLSTRTACSVYLGGTRSHNEGRIWTPACSTYVASPCQTLRELLAGAMSKHIPIAQPIN